MAQPFLTLVFTDVVGSSAAKRDAALGADISDRDRAYLDAIQTEHLRVVRSAVEKYHGKEIMTMGDAFFLTFGDPVDAVRCCAAIHQRLVTHPIDTPGGPLQLRMGIHAGTPKFFENSWHGTDVDIAARVQSTAVPQQILVTDATRHLIGDPMGISFHRLGTFALKGIGDVKIWDADYDRHGVRVPALRSKEQNKKVRRLKLGVSFLSVLFSLTVISWQLWRTHEKNLADTAIAAAAAKPKAAPSSIIVADFENKTGDSVFDGTLTQAFSIQLQQSPVLSVVSPEHLRKSMQYLGKSPNDPLTPDIARQIGVREGVKAFITGSISKIGDAYLIEVTAIDPESGDPLASEQATATDKSHILSALGTVTTTMRTKLGESLASIQKLDTPMDEATTSSLEAFRAYTLGVQAASQGKFVPEAEEHFRQAVTIDPNFAMAWTELGSVYNINGQFGEEYDCYTRAFALSKGVSERERYLIEYKYYNRVSGDIPKAIETLELACRTYPLDTYFSFHLAAAQLPLGQFEAGLANLKKAIEGAPPDARTRWLYLAVLLQLDHYSEAQAFSDESRRLGMMDELSLQIDYSLQFLTGNEAGMQKDAAQMAGKDDEYNMTQTIASCQELAGQYRKADESWKRAAAQAIAHNAKDAAAMSLQWRVSGRALAELPDDSAGELKAAISLDQSELTQDYTCYAAAFANQPHIALPIMADLAKKYPDNTFINKIVIPQNRAALTLAAHQPQAALDSTEGYNSVGWVPSTLYLRGLAYLQLNDGPHAVDAFRDSLRYRGVALGATTQCYPQAQLGLARAYVMTGDQAAAKKAYDAFFITWKDADADLPQLVAAKKEYAAITAERN